MGKYEGSFAGFLEDSGFLSCYGIWRVSSICLVRDGVYFFGRFGRKLFRLLG